MKYYLSKEWLAGFFDGEGCIYLRRKLNHKPHYQLTFYLTNADKDILMLVASIYGGIVRMKKNGVYVWVICRKDLQIKFLTDIEQHLILKKPQAKMALIYLSTTVDNNLRQKGISDKSLAIREKIYFGLKSEKRRFSAKNRIKDLI